MITVVQPHRAWLLMHGKLKKKLREIKNILKYEPLLSCSRCLSFFSIQFRVPFKTNITCEWVKVRALDFCWNANQSNEVTFQTNPSPKWSGLRTQELRTGLGNGCAVAEAFLYFSNPRKYCTFKFALSIARYLQSPKFWLSAKRDTKFRNITTKKFKKSIIKLALCKDIEVSKWVGTSENPN